MSDQGKRADTNCPRCDEMTSPHSTKWHQFLFLACNAELSERRKLCSSAQVRSSSQQRGRIDTFEAIHHRRALHGASTYDDLITKSIFVLLLFIPPNPTEMEWYRIKQLSLFTRYHHLSCFNKSYWNTGAPSWYIRIMSFYFFFFGVHILRSADEGWAVIIIDW